MIDPTPNDIGRAVTYVPSHAGLNLGHPDCEHGVVQSFNQHWVFVQYGDPFVAKATSRQDLFWDFPT